MSDDENEEHVEIHVTGGYSAEQIEHYRMHLQANAHDSIRIFDELSEEHLLRLRGILQAIQTDPSTIGYFTGVASSHLKFRFGFCMACGVNHDAELKNLAGDGGPDGPPIKVEEEERDGVEQEVEDDLSGPWTPLMLSKEEFEKLCDLNNVDWTDDGSLRCRDCGATSVNLPDRLRRRPGKAGCEGCIQKEKWG